MDRNERLKREMLRKRLNTLIKKANELLGKYAIDCILIIRTPNNKYRVYSLREDINL